MTITLTLALLAGYPLAARSQVATRAEWTLEEARRCWSPMVRPVQHVGVPGNQFQTGVMWDGGLVFGPLAYQDLGVMLQEVAPLGDHPLHLSIGFGETMQFADRHGSGSQRVRRALDGGRLPIPLVETTDGELRWNEVVFADLLGRSLEDGAEPRAGDLQVTHAIFTVTNDGQSEHTGHLWLHCGDTSQVRFGYKCSIGPELAPQIQHRFEPPFGVWEDQVRYVLRLPSQGQLRWHDEVAVEGATAPARNVLEWQVALAPGASATLQLSIPYGWIDRESARALETLDLEQRRLEARKYWGSVVHGAGQILTPDSFVNDYLAAVVGQMAQQVAWRERSTSVWMYKTSPNYYEGYWPCNAAKAIPTLTLRGQAALERRVLQSFIDQQTEDVRGMEKGAMGRDENLPGEGYARIDGFLGNFGDWTANPLLLSHGLGMWALASHYRITRDDAWLTTGKRSPLQAMLAAFDWVATQRQRTMREVEGEAVPYYGLLPAASAHDWLAGNTIFNDAFCLYGMIEIARLLRETDHPRADQAALEVQAYRECLAQRYLTARDHARPLPLDDGTTIPYVPRIVQELDWAMHDWTYTGYGPLRAGAWGALDPHHPLVGQTLAFLATGMPRGEGPYFSAHLANPDTADRNWADISQPEASRHFLWRHYVEYETMWPVGGPLFLARDDVGRFTEWLFHNLAAVIHQDWRVGVESLDGAPSCAPGDGERWQLIRRMFVNETGGYDGSEQSLFLLQAIPRSWLRPGSRLAVKDMATWFGGHVDVEAQVAKDGSSLLVELRMAGLRVAPKEVWMRLRSSDGRPLTMATVDGDGVDVVDGDRITLPRSTDQVLRIVGHF